MDIRNVVLISIDTCRADRLSCYGYKRQTTPNIDAVARDGVQFDSALTPVPLTLPAHSSMLTGTYPPTHGVHLNNGERLAASNVTLAKLLRDAGYQTAAFIGAFPLDSRFGLNRGFDVYDFQETRKPTKNDYGERKAEEVNRPALLWLEQHAAKPFFLFLHYFDPHQPYDPPSPYLSLYADEPYAGEIAYVDSCIGRVVDRLRALGSYDNTLLIITGDHGQGLGQHGETSHSYYIYQSTLRVPLIIRAPRGHKGRQIAENVSLVDIMPTVLDLVGLEMPPRVEGASLRRCLEGVPGSDQGGRAPDRLRPIYCESIFPATFGCGPLHGILEGQWKYIRAPRPELYDLVRDSGELNNLIGQEPLIAQRLRGRLETMLQKMEAQSPKCDRSTADPETVKRLESLGYAGGGVPTPASVYDPKLEDPKDFLSTGERLISAQNLLDMNCKDQAEREFLDILARRPNLVLAHRFLGQIALDDHRVTDAKQHFARIFSILAEQGDASSRIPAAEAKATRLRCHMDMADALASEGMCAEAEVEYANALRIEPNLTEAHNNLGNMLERTGKLGEAIAHYEEALRTKPDSVEAHYNLGGAFAKRGQGEQAIAHLQKAIDIKPDYLEAQCNLGVALAGCGRIDEAIAQFKKALQINPDSVEAHVNLGVALAGRGQLNEAIVHYEKALELNPGLAEVRRNLEAVRSRTGGP